MASVICELVHTDGASSRSSKYTRKAILVVATILLLLVVHQFLSSDHDTRNLFWEYGETEHFLSSGGSLSVSFAGMTSTLNEFEHNNTIMLTVANPAYGLFLENWDCYAKPLIGRRFLVFTNDYDFGRRISEQDGYHVLVQSSRSWWRPATTDDQKKALYYGTVEYQRLILKRTLLVAHLLEIGKSVLIVDNDAVWLSNPLPYLEGNDAHIVTTKDGTVEKDDVICGGFLYLKQTPTTRRVWSKVTRQHQALVAWAIAFTPKSEQTVLNEIFLAERSMSTVNAKKNEPLRVHFLDPLLFPNGIFYFSDGHPQSVNVTPVVIHNNWILGYEGKLERFQSFGLWKVAGEDTAGLVNSLGRPVPLLAEAGRGHRCIT